MIIKFPNLSGKDIEKIKHYLEQKFHHWMSVHHKYSACGNEDEALKHQSYASAINSVLNDIQYHREISDYNGNNSDIFAKC